MSVAAKLSVCVTVVECTKTNHSHQNALEMHVKASESNIAQCGEVWVPESELFKLYLTCLHCQQQPLHLLSLSLCICLCSNNKKSGLLHLKDLQKRRPGNNRAV